MKSLARRMLAVKTKTVTLILVAVAILAVGAGAAVGTVMRGDLEAKIPVTVEQALIVEKPQAMNFPSGRKFQGSVSDDHTRFGMALEMYRGDTLRVLIPLVNRSSGDTVSQLSVVIPDIPSLIEGKPGLLLSVEGAGLVEDAVKISPDTWTFTSDAGLNGLQAAPPDGLVLTFTVSSTAMSGYFEITGRIKAVEF